VVSSFGVGKTLLSAFDAALFNSGVHNYNLIYLSSVIPPSSNITEVKQVTDIGGEWGDRLYVVHADSRSDVEGAYAGAGVGWYQFDDGRGVFVEHSGKWGSMLAAEESLQDQIRKSIKDLCIVRGIKYVESDVNMRLSVGVVKKEPVCALVLAVFKVESWFN